MAFPYYNYSGAFIPGTLARAETVGVEFTSVQTGFALLSNQGSDTGVLNGLVVNTPYAPTALTDGAPVWFKPAFTNTGACTLNVNATGVRNLVGALGSAIQPGVLNAGFWYQAVWSALQNAWILTAPSTVLTSGTITISGVVPTHKVGLVAAAGTSLAAAPIDVTFAIDQSIAPTWTGAHIFTAGITAPLTINAAAAQVSLTVQGAANQYAVRINGSSTSGQSFGLEIFAGTTSADLAIVVSNQASSINFLQIFGDGHGQLGPSATLALSWNTAGAVTIAAPTSGTALTVTGASGAAAGNFVGVSGGGGLQASTTAASGGGNYAGIFSGITGAARDILAAQQNGFSNGFTVKYDGTQMQYSFLNGNVVIGAPSSGAALTVNGLAGTTGLSFVTASHTGAADFDAQQLNLGPTAAASAAGGQIQFRKDTGVASWAIGHGHNAANINFFIYDLVNGREVLNAAPGGNVTIDTPLSGVPLTVNGLNENYLITGSASSWTGGFIAGTTNGLQMGSQSAHGATIFTNNITRITINSSGNVTISAPASAKALVVNGASGDFAAQLVGNSASGNSYGLSILAGTTSADAALAVGNQANSATFLKIFGDGHGTLGPNTTNDLSWNTAGNFNIASPSSGSTLTVNGLSAVAAITMAVSGNQGLLQNAAGVNAIVMNSSGTNYGQIQNDAGNLWSLATGTTPTVLGTKCLQWDSLTEVGIATPSSIGNLSAGMTQVGYMDTPQNSITANYTLALTDRGKSIYINGTTAAQTVTIPANASVAFPVSTTIIIVNRSNQNWSIAITTDTIKWLPSNTAGTRTLAPGGVATLYKEVSNTWLLWGFNIT